MSMSSMRLSPKQTQEYITWLEGMVKSLQAERDALKAVSETRRERMRSAMSVIIFNG